MPFPRKQLFGGEDRDREEQLQIWLAAAVETDACLRSGAFLEFLDERGAHHFNDLAKDVRDARQQGRKRVIQRRFNVGGLEATPESNASTL